VRRRWLLGGLVGTLQRRGREVFVRRELADFDIERTEVLGGEVVVSRAMAALLEPAHAEASGGAAHYSRCPPRPRRVKPRTSRHIDGRDEAPRDGLL
jgi:hypothetical protein